MLWLKSESSRGAAEKRITEQRSKHQPMFCIKPVFRDENANEEGGQASKTVNADDAVALGIGNMHPDDISSTSSILTTTHNTTRDRLGEKSGVWRRNEKMYLFRPKQDRSDLGYKVPRRVTSWNILFYPMFWSRSAGKKTWRHCFACQELDGVIGNGAWQIDDYRYLWALKIIWGRAWRRGSKHWLMA